MSSRDAVCILYNLLSLSGLSSEVCAVWFNLVFSAVRSCTLVSLWSHLATQKRKLPRPLAEPGVRARTLGSVSGAGDGTGTLLRPGPRTKQSV